MVSHRRRIENAERVCSRLASASLAYLDNEVRRVNARLLGPPLPTLRERISVWMLRRSPARRTGA